VEAFVVELQHGLLLALALALGLASRAGHVCLLFLLGERLAFGELLSVAFVGLAGLCGSKVELLLSQLGEIGRIRLGLILRLGLLSRCSITCALTGKWICRLGIGVPGFARCGDSLLLFFLGYSLASLLVGPFIASGLATPSVGNLLLVLSYASSAVTVARMAAAAASSTTSTSTASTISRFTGFSRCSAAILVAITSTPVSSITASSAGSGVANRGFGGRVALAGSRNRLINCLGGWLGFSVGVELGVVP